MFQWISRFSPTSIALFGSVFYIPVILIKGFTYCSFTVDTSVRYSSLIRVSTTVQEIYFSYVFSAFIAFAIIFLVSFFIMWLRKNKLATTFYNFSVILGVVPVFFSLDLIYSWPCSQLIGKTVAPSDESLVIVLSALISLSLGGMIVSFFHVALSSETTKGVQKKSRIIAILLFVACVALLQILQESRSQIPVNTDPVCTICE